MDLKGIVKKIVPNTAEEATAESTSRKCANGHVLDPTWGDFCPFCDAKNRAHEKSPQPHLQATAFQPTAIMPTAAASDRRTRIADSFASSGRETKVDPGDGRGAPRQQGPDNRRIVGVLMTYTWRESGEMFAVREGKNRIGAGGSSEEGHRPCEIQIATDSAMSGEHALILCRMEPATRQIRYELADLNSSNGTFLNDSMVSSQAVTLESGAKIKTGNTVFQFLKFELDASAPGVAAPPEREEKRTRDPGSSSIE